MLASAATPLLQSTRCASPWLRPVFALTPFSSWPRPPPDVDSDVVYMQVKVHTPGGLEAVQVSHRMLTVVD